MGWYEFLFKFFILPYKADVIPALNGKSISLCFDSDYTKTYTTKDGKTFMTGTQAAFREEIIIVKLIRTLHLCI